MINTVTENYNWLWTQGDFRVNGWLLMSSIKPVLFFLVLYMILIYYGPKWMHTRPPFNFHWTVLFSYNMGLAVFNLHIFLELAVLTTRQGYDWMGEPVRLSTDPDELRIVAAFHLYFISKLIELLDTVFMIVRKKNNQLTFLHTYHHSTMLLLTWSLCRWAPGGNVVLAALTNSLVHVLMYSYYGMTLLGPNFTKYLWWKRYITAIQLSQFVIGITVGVNVFFKEYTFNKWLIIFNQLYMLSYMFLFGRFYVNAYINVKSQTKIGLRDGNELANRQVISEGVCFYDQVNSSKTD